MRLNRAAFLSFFSFFSFPFFFYKKKKKKNTPSQRGCYFSCSCLLCDWSFIPHSAPPPVSSAEPAFTQSWQTKDAGFSSFTTFSSRKSSSHFLIFTTLITVRVPVASSIFSYLLWPLFSDFCWNLQQQTLKAKLHHSPRLL